MVGLYLDFAVNSINIANSQWESETAEMGVGIVVNTGSMVRIEGNTFEKLAGPAIVANQINALTIRENYFEGNNMLPTAFVFVTGSGATNPPTPPGRVVPGVCT